MTKSTARKLFVTRLERMVTVPNIRVAVSCQPNRHFLFGCFLFLTL